MKKRSDFQGLEFDWFAVDSDGFVALMSSAGHGPIPDAVFERFDGQRHIEEFLGRLIGSRTADDCVASSSCSRKQECLPTTGSIGMGHTSGSQCRHIHDV